MPCASGARRTQAWRGLRRGASAVAGHGAGGGAERARGRERRSRVRRVAPFSARAWRAPRRGGRGRGCAAIRPVAVLARIGRRLSHRQGRAAPRRIAGAAVLDLNTRTSIALRAAGVELISGEAAISLAGASSPFTVSAAGGRVVAQDAVFELRHTDGSVCVTCLSGAVEVALASGGATRRRSGWSMTRRACSPRARWMPTICRPGAGVSCASGRRPWPRCWTRSTAIAPAASS